MPLLGVPIETLLSTRLRSLATQETSRCQASTGYPKCRGAQHPAFRGYGTRSSWSCIPCFSSRERSRLLQVLELYWGWHQRCCGWRLHSQACALLSQPTHPMVVRLQLPRNRGRRKRCEKKCIHHEQAKIVKSAPACRWAPTPWPAAARSPPLASLPSPMPPSSTLPSVTSVTAPALMALW